MTDLPETRNTLGQPGTAEAAATVPEGPFAGRAAVVYPGGGPEAPAWRLVPTEPIDGATAEAAPNIPTRRTVIGLGAAALARTAANTAITAADFGGFAFIPGEVVSWAADAAKIAKQAKGVGIDLTPDVSWKVATYTEFLEVFGGVIPTHIIESVMQLRHDLPRMGRAFLALMGAKPKAHWYDPPRVRTHKKR